MRGRPAISLLVLVLVGLLVGPAAEAQSEPETVPTSLTVVDVLDQPATPTDTGYARVIVRFNSGSLAGDTFVYSHQLWGHPLYDPPLERGRQFAAQVTLEDGNLVRLELGQVRKDYVLLLLFGALTLGLLLVAGWPGLVGLICSLATLAGVLFVFFPLVFTTPLILGAGVLLCVLAIVVTIPLVVGFEPPAPPAVGSLILVTLIAFGLTEAGMSYLNLNPDNARHSRLILTELNRAPGVTLASLRPLLVVGIVLGTLGAMMDVAVVISSTVHEIMRDQRATTLTEGFKSGMRVGREILSTMVNTLIFAYVGILLPLLLALHVFELPWLYFLNFSFVGIEILRINVGLLGLSLIIPATAFTSAWWFSR